MHSVFIGYDPRFQTAYDVAEKSLREKCAAGVKVLPIVLSRLKSRGLYNRPTSIKDGQLYDEISAAPMSTEFAISRFMAPFLSGYQGWALFCDSDFLFRSDIADVFARADEKYAVMCVRHDYRPREGLKMDGQAQTRYPRKNWSSFMLFNNAHPANRLLTLDRINTLPGRDLHRFCWLKDEEIGGLPHSWNWLEGHSGPEIVPDAVHFTRGTPDIPGYEDVLYADEWRLYAGEQTRLKAA
jgi:hypothetical protein